MKLRHAAWALRGCTPSSRAGRQYASKVVCKSLVTLVTAFTLAACAVQQGGALDVNEPGQKTFARPADLTHIYVTAEEPSTKLTYTVLGIVNCTEPLSQNSADETKIKQTLADIALAKWPDSVDALVDEKTEVSEGGGIKASAVAIHYVHKAVR